MAFNGQNPVHISELGDELNNDPQSIGYATHITSGAHSTLAFMLNDTATYSASVDVEFITAIEAQAAVDDSDFDALNANDLRRWLIIISLRDGIPVKNANIRAQVLAIWAPGTTTRSNLAGLQTKTGTRAEELWGDGSFINHTHVAIALGP